MSEYMVPLGNRIVRRRIDVAFLIPTRGDPKMTVKEKAERDRFLAGAGCPQMLKVSKHLAGPLKLFPGEPCRCECKAGGRVQTVFRVNYRAVLRFDTAKPCDETELEPLLQAGTELWLDGTLTLRDD